MSHYTNMFRFAFLAISTLYFSSAYMDTYGQSYGNLPMGGAGFVSGIVTSKTEPGLKYIRTDVGGAYIWDNENSSWSPILDWPSTSETGYLGVESLALDPRDPDKLYMSVGISYFNNGKSAILRSSDRGKTFSITDVTSLFKVNGNGMGRNTGEKLVVDPNLGSVLFCGSRDKGLFKSTDSGASWSNVSSFSVTTTSTGNGLSFVLFDPLSGELGSFTQTLIIGVSRTGENLYRSDNGGGSFSAVAGAPTTLMPNRAALGSDGNLFITYANAAGPYDPNTGQIWKYNLASGTWTNITPSGYSFAFGGISVDPANPLRLVATSINVYRSQGGNQWGDVIFLSNNGGTSWVNKITSGYKLDPNGIEWAKNGVAIHWAGCIEFDPFNTKRVSVNSGNGVFTTENIDSTTNVWKFDVKGLEETVPNDMVSIPGGPVVTVVGDYDGFRYSDITKYGKQNIPIMGTTVGLAYASLNPKMLARTGGDKNGGKMYISSDTAKTWKAATINGYQGYLSFSADGNVLLHSPEGSGLTYRSTDAGSSWNTVNGLYETSARTIADAVNSTVFYCYSPSGGRIWISLDGGISFFASGTPGTGGSKHIRTVPGLEGNIWIALYNGGLTHSIDYGASFVKIKNVTSCSAVGFGKSAPGMDYPVIYIWGVVGGVAGMYFSTDQGGSWNRMNDNEHEWGGPGNGQFVIGDMNTLGIAYMSTAGRGIVYAKPDYILSSSHTTIQVDSTTQVFASVLNEETVSWTWSSGNPAVAEVSPAGIVTGISEGSATITATAGNGKTLDFAVLVANPLTSISIDPVVDSIAISEIVQLTATISPADATNQKITWSSTNTAVAAVNTTGALKGFKTGKTIISAVSTDGVIASFPLVVGIPVSGISISPAADTIAILEKAQLTSIFTPSNTTENKIKWSSSAPAIATVDQTGLVTGKAVGSADILATSQDVVLVASAKIVVEDPTAVLPVKSLTGDIRIYPNPLAGKQLNIDLGNLTGKVSFRIIDALGRTVLEKTGITERQFQMDMNLRPGIYLLKFENDQEYLVKSLLVQ